MMEAGKSWIDELNLEEQEEVRQVLKRYQEWQALTPRERKARLQAHTAQEQREGETEHGNK